MLVCEQSGSGDFNAMTTTKILRITTMTLVFLFSASLTTTASQKRFDGKWWTSLDSDEQYGFIVGFIDCYQDTLRRKIRSRATTQEYQRALDQFYAKHTDKNSVPVTDLMVTLVQTLKTSTHYLPGGEVWTEPHGFLDDQYWRESTDKERIGFLEGYIHCYQKYMRRPQVRFSRTAEEYSELLSKYFDDPAVDHTDEKIADVLHRFAARPVPARN